MSIQLKYALGKYFLTLIVNTSKFNDWKLPIFAIQIKLRIFTTEFSSDFGYINNFSIQDKYQSI